MRASLAGAVRRVAPVGAAAAGGAPGLALAPAPAPAGLGGTAESESSPSPVSPTTPPAHDPFALWRAVNAAPPPASATGAGAGAGAGRCTAEPWAACVAVVGFHPDRGPVVEAICPEGALAPAQQDLVAAHAMPDSAAGGVGREDAEFCFRIPATRAGHRGGDFAAPDSARTTSTGAAPQPSGRATRREQQPLLLAHTLFRQAPDPAAPRGGFQKALVLVTSTPYVGLPHTLLRALAPEAFGRGLTALRRAVEDLAAWPDPRVQHDTRALDLRFARSSIALSLPEPFLSSFAAPHGAVHAVEQDAGQLPPCTVDNDDEGSDDGYDENIESAGGDENGNHTGRVGVDGGKDNGSPHLSSDGRRASDSSSEESMIFAGHVDSSSKSSLSALSTSACTLVSDDGMSSDLPGPDLERHRNHVGTRLSTPARRHLRPLMNVEVPVSEQVGPAFGSAPLVRAMPLCMPASNALAAPFHEVDPVRALGGAHDRLWALWELVALGEPILVFAPTPSQCAAAVLAIIGLLHPLPFMGDWRPYMTIQDPDYSRFVAASNSLPELREALPHGAVFGVTNPLMLGSLHFPHVLTVTGSGNRGMNVSYKSGLKTSHTAHLHKSRHLASAMHSSISAQQKSDEKGTCVAAYEVRAMLLDRVTRPFLRAFDRYLVPTWGENFLPLTVEPYASDPYGHSVQLARFDDETFPTNEDLSAPGVLALFTGSKSRARVFYSRFVKGPVFRAWWAAVRSVALRECAARHRKDLLENCVRGTGFRDPNLAGDLEHDADRRNEVIDFALRVRLEIAGLSKGDVALAEKLSALLLNLAASLSDDLRQTICPDTGALLSRT